MYHDIDLRAIKSLGATSLTKIKKKSVHFCKPIWFFAMQIGHGNHCVY